jgi:hypothetical protein
VLQELQDLQDPVVLLEVQQDLQEFKVLKE